MAARTKEEIMAQIVVLEAFCNPKNNASQNEVEIARKRIAELRARLATLMGIDISDIDDTLKPKPRIEVSIHRGMIHVRLIDPPGRPAIPGIHLTRSCSIKRTWIYKEGAIVAVQSFLGIYLTDEERNMIYEYLTD